MAITQKIQNRLSETVAALRDSKTLSLSDKDDYIEILSEAAEGTNGLTVEEKTQANSVNIFNLCYLFLRDKVEGRPTGFWPCLFRLIERCRWQITIIVLGAFALLAYRPQIAAILDHFAPK